MFKRVEHIGIVVSDLERSIGFYKNVLNLEIGEKWEFEPGTIIGGNMKLPRTVVFVKADNTMIELLDYGENKKNKPEETTGKTIGITHIAFTVENIHGFVKRLKEKGVTFDTDPVKVKDNLTVAFFKDPDGNILELYETK